MATNCDYQFHEEIDMYAQAAIKPNTLLRNGAYGIVMRAVQSEIGLTTTQVVSSIFMPVSRTFRFCARFQILRAPLRKTLVLRNCINSVCS